jgi:foldase protein PrsA
VQLVAVLMATLSFAHTEPAVTVNGVRAIERDELARWTRAVKQERRALDILIRSAWFEGEAREQGIVVTARQVRARLRAEGNRPAPNGLTRADVVKRQRAELFAETIRERIGTMAAQSVTQEQIDAYVQAHPRTEPETRSFRVILTRSERTARRATRALKAGVSWRTVARRYSLDEASARQGGLQPPVTRDLLPARLRRAAFGAERGELVGPIRTQFGYHVLRLVEIVPEHPTPLKTQRAAAWEVLAGEAQQNALEAADAAFTAKWRPRTVCAPDLAGHRGCGTT